MCKKWHGKTWNGATSYKAMRKMHDNKYEAATMPFHIRCARSGMQTFERTRNRNDSDVKRNKPCKYVLRLPEITTYYQRLPKII